MASPKTRIRKAFPKLGVTDFKITSPITTDYNCIAHAADEDDRCWWPISHPRYYWPPGLPRENTLASFIAGYGTLGYVPCDSFEEEEGYEKVVIYVDANGEPKHAAKMLPGGRWTSKLGDWEDIDHKALAGVSGVDYGHPKQALKRPKK